VAVEKRDEPAGANQPELRAGAVGLGAQALSPAESRKLTPRQVDGQGSRDPVRARPLTAVARGAYTEGVALMVRRSGSCEEMPR